MGTIGVTSQRSALRNILPTDSPRTMIVRGHKYHPHDKLGGSQKYQYDQHFAVFS